MLIAPKVFCFITNEYNNFGFLLWPNTNCSEFRLPKTQLYKVFQLNVSISLDLCVCHHKMLSNQIFSIKQKC